MASESKESIKFKGTPVFFAELTKHFLEQLKGVIDDPALALDIEPNFENQPQTNIVKITFQTKSKTRQESRSGAGGWLNSYAKQAGRIPEYYDYGMVIAKTGPNNETLLDILGYQTGQDSPWLKLWQWPYTKLSEEGYIIRQASMAENAADDRNSPNSYKHTKRISAIALFVLGVFIALATNIASSTLPKDWGPYLGLSWLLLVILIVISILLLKE